MNVSTRRMLLYGGRLRTVSYAALHWSSLTLTLHVRTAYSHPLEQHGIIISPAPYFNMVYLVPHATLLAPHGRSWVTATIITVGIDVFVRKPISVLILSVLHTIRGTNHTPLTRAA